MSLASEALLKPADQQDQRNAHGEIEKRDERELLFAFKKRALVHFAVDPDECYMTTRLARDQIWELR